MDSPIAYLILGAAGSGRREIFADLTEHGLFGEPRPLWLLSANETARLDSTPLAERNNSMAGTWRMNDGRIEAKVLEGATHVFFFADGRANPIDQIEAFERWIKEEGLQLGRVITVVSCQLAHDRPQLLPWFDACIHFSDAVLLNRREQVPNKWISDFLARYKKREALPALFELVKRHEVENPALILEPETRRISRYFDEPDFDLEDDEDDETEGDEPVELNSEPHDPYMEIDVAGRRIKPLPNIADFL
jgi:hypothetical protein